MKDDWAIVGCAYMAKEYCKALRSKGIAPYVFSRDLSSPNVKSFQSIFPDIEVKELADIPQHKLNWIVCTKIESHDAICDKLSGRVYCEKPYSLDTTYDATKDITILMNRRYYYWVSYIKEIIDRQHIVKIIASVPETSERALITQSIHVIDLLWYLAGPFQTASKVGSVSPTYFLTTEKDIPLVINMNYGSHENFSLRFYRDDGVVYEAKPLESFSFTEGMEVREPDDEFPLRSYRPIVHPLMYTPTNHKPGVGELVDDLLDGASTRLPTLMEHRRIHVWMEENMA